MKKLRKFERYFLFKKRDSEAHSFSLDQKLSHKLPNKTEHTRIFGIKCSFVVESRSRRIIKVKNLS